MGGFAAHWLILIVAGEQYLAAAPVFRLMLWNLVIYAFQQPQRPLFYALGQQKWLFVLYAISTVAYAVLLWAGILTLNVIGSVWAMLLNSGVFAGVRMLVLWLLEPQMWIDPRSIFRVDGFDRRMWQVVRERVSRHGLSKL
jgi:O-antigen/teichoic acid export membrane protein